jgi:hypothetical protein
VKRLFVINACAVSLSAIAGWLLIDWTRAALVASPQGQLPLPAFTVMVFKLKSVLLAPVVLFGVAALKVGQSNTANDSWTTLAVGLAMFAILFISVTVSVACVLPWVSHVP